MMTRNTVLKLLGVALLASAISACGSDMDQLDAYINEVKARPGGRIEPLPEITPYEVFTYDAGVEGIRSPFQPDAPGALTAGAGGVSKDMDRVPEFLEQKSLDSLRMVGTLDIDGTNYGLVQDSDGLIHRVIPGNYMGQNDGRITAITDSEITLVEIISDGIGGYIERDAAISLTD